MLKGRWFQPPLYYLLAQAVLGKKEGSFEYHFIEEAAAGKKWQLILDSKTGARRDRIEALLRNVVEGISSGRFFIAPGEHCRNCEFSTIFRKSHYPSKLRASRDPEARAWCDHAEESYEKPPRPKKKK